MSIEAIKLTDPHDHPEPHTMKWTQLEMDYINKRVEAAVRTALEQAEQDTKTPLKVLDLTVRVECLLRRGRVYDVETLKAMDVRHLLAIPDFGKKALKEVSEALLKYELVTERRLIRKQRDSEAKLKEKNT